MKCGAYVYGVPPTLRWTTLWLVNEGRWSFGLSSGFPFILSDVIGAGTKQTKFKIMASPSPAVPEGEEAHVRPTHNSFFKVPSELELARQSQKLFSGEECLIASSGKEADTVSRELCNATNFIV